jgi:hypothetical protein
LRTVASDRDLTIEERNRLERTLAKLRGYVNDA